jgi:hypothetical protein
MKARVCICCGEAIAEGGDALSRNPNLCASCSSMADGMEEPDSSVASRAAAAGERKAADPIPDLVSQAF